MPRSRTVPTFIHGHGPWVSQRYRVSYCEAEVKGSNVFNYLTTASRLFTSSNGIAAILLLGWSTQNIVLLS